MNNAKAVLGLALAVKQLRRTLTFSIAWTVLAAAAEKNAPKAIVKADERQRFGARVTGGLHAVSTSLLCFWILLDKTETQDIDKDRMYGYSDRTNLLFAHSCGFFLWDIYICLAREKIDLGFLLHGIACFLCYLFGQFPFLHYYGVRFLLFELSTPFLNLMLILKQLGKVGKFHDMIKMIFGYSFLLVRIFYGFLLSGGFFMETIDLVRNGKPHSMGVALYYMAANFSLNMLNLMWLSQMIAAKSKSSSVNPPASL